MFIFIQQLVALLLQLGEWIPYRALFGVMMCLQMLLGPSMVFNGLEEFQVYKMKVTETEYFYYVLPAVICFLFGLYVKGKQEGEQMDHVKVEKSLIKHRNAPFILIALGMVPSIISSVSGSLNFVMYLFTMFKFVGLFLILIGDYKFKFAWLGGIVAVEIGLALKFGLFHDLLIYMILIGSVVCLRYKFSLAVKVSAFVLFCMLAIFIQSIKQTYRSITWEGWGDSNIETLQEASRQSQETSGSFFSLENMAPQVTRINQGWIVASIMDNVPSKEPFANGETIGKYLEAALLPRFLAPNKLEAGDIEIFIRYSGIMLSQGTSMGLSSVGDAYANYGIFGGWVFMFLYGLLFNLTLKIIGRQSKKYPTLILFSAIIFVYPIRPDCELQTILGHLFKASFLIFVMFRIYGKYLKYDEEDEETVTQEVMA